MRTSADVQSPWRKRVWFEESEFEELMDHQRELLGPGSFEAGKGVDVEAIFERVHGIVPDYVSLPDGVQGRTTFRNDGQIHIEISRELADAAESSRVERRRVRSTGAHELAHVVFHRGLFAIDTLTGSLFPDADQPEPIVCRAIYESSEPGSTSGYDGRWWEFQANRGMACLLLPRTLVRVTLQDALRSANCECMEDALEQQKAMAVLRGVADVFDVNPKMCLFRMQGLDLLPNDPNQTTLARLLERE